MRADGGSFRVILTIFSGPSLMVILSLYGVNKLYVKFSQCEKYFLPIYEVSLYKYCSFAWAIFRN